MSAWDDYSKYSGLDWFENLFGNDDPEAAANKYYNQIPGMAKQYYDPYMNAGKDSLDKLQGLYGQLMSNPGAYYNQLGQGFKNSPGYANALGQATASANNGAAMGMGGGLGTPGHINNVASAAGNVANTDFENYMKNVLGLNKQGIGGEQDIEDQGFKANMGYSDLLASVLGAQGTNAANAANGRNQARSQDWSNLFGFGEGFASGFF